MKTLSTLTLITAVVFVACGCNPDHSGDTRAPIPASEITPAPTVGNGGGPNTNIPQSAKDALKNSVPGMGSK